MWVTLKKYSSIYYSPVHNGIKKKFIENRPWGNKTAEFTTIEFVKTWLWSSLWVLVGTRGSRSPYLRLSVLIFEMRKSAWWISRFLLGSFSCLVIKLRLQSRAPDASPGSQPSPVHVVLYNEFPDSHLCSAGPQYRRWPLQLTSKKAVCECFMIYAVGKMWINGTWETLPPVDFVIALWFQNWIFFREFRDLRNWKVLRSPKRDRKHFYHSRMVSLCPFSINLPLLFPSANILWFLSP